MSHAEIRDLVLAALADVAPEADPATLDPTAPLAGQVDLDSMDFLMFMGGVAERTGVDVPERDYARVATLDDCVAYVAGRAAAAAG